MEDNQQMVVTYTYDPAGALIMITSPDGSIFTGSAIKESIFAEKPEPEVKD